MSFGRLSVAIVGLLGGTVCAAPVEPVDWVRPTIGNVSHMLVPTSATVSRPNGMLRFNPPYSDPTAHAFESLGLMTPSHRGPGLFRLRLYSGSGNALDSGDWSTWDQAHCRPYAYDVWLDSLGIRFSIALGNKSGVAVMKFERAGNQAAVFSPRAKEGTVEFKDGGVNCRDVINGVNVYLRAEFDEKPVRTENRDGKKLGVWFEDRPHTVSMRFAVSYISPEQARKNLESEQTDFDFMRVVSEARKAWNDKLGLIEVEGGTDDERTVFYTALYRCFERMVDVTEDGRYFGWDRKVHPLPDGRRAYNDDWVWDTFRVHHPLMVLLQPKEQGDKLSSYINFSRENAEGWMPTFPTIGFDAHVMNGLHTVSLFLDAWRKGVRGFDLKAAYAACAKTFRESTKTPWKRGPKNELDAFYDQNGWFPALHPDEKETVKDVVPWEKRQAVAVTQAASYDAWCLSELAREVGDDAGAKEFGAQVTNYRKLWKADSQFFHPKDKDGKWIEPFDYKSSGGFAALHYYDENNAWTYLWDIQHDIPGLIALFGGGKAMEAKLDRMQGESLGKRRFEWMRDLPDSTGMIGQFSMGNEPSFHIPYLYVHAGNPRKTQKFVRKVLSTWFRNDLMGIPGDEDGGGMSAFVVFSMMGFYPITPGLPQYTWGSPVFRRVTIHLANGKAFTIDAPNASADAKYIRSIAVDGRKVDVCSPLAHADILRGITVELDMSKH